jgi:hypothetical protein
MNHPRQTRSFALLLLACLAVSLFFVIYPIYVIRPFRSQGARELAAALVVARFRGTLTLISAVGAIVALVWYWRALPRRRWRVLAAAGTGLVAVLAVLARLNVYQLMFHPVDHPSFVAAPQVKLDKDEKVIVVKVAGEARAYPIRSMSYHHLVNDVVGRVAIIATY